uniref:molecular chaperone DnaJ n=1 Tax=Milkweed yellows phytoplasma TaxID=208434 RepID=UPI000474D669|nr:molecular chaperone DnaJ [Milkweed yellows phytoplasma]
MYFEKKKNYYSVLGLTKEASESEIKSAYRKLSKKFHPDVYKEADAESKFKEVQEAYQTLKDPNKKANYDRFGHTGDTGGFGGGFEGFGGGGSFNFEDLFENFFGSSGSQRQGRNNNVGADLHIEITIDFLESALGVEKDIKFHVEEDCQHCRGTGAKNAQSVQTCSYCHGNGYVVVNQQTILGNIPSRQICPQCRGEKQTILHKCSSCKGQKRVKKVKQMNLQIPAGVESGMTLRSPQNGNGGHLGAANGDLLVDIKVRPHEHFKRDEQNIITTLFIDFYQAVLGTTISVATIYGDVELKIPAGTQTDTKLRLKNKGIAYLNSSRKGDHYVVVKIKTPTKISNTEKELFLKLQELDRLNNNVKKNRSWFF